MRYVLMLNDMREGNIENLRAVRVGTRDELVAFHEGERVDRWSDEAGGCSWRKSFAPGSELEWFNPGRFDEDCAFFGGVYPLPEGMPDDVAMNARLSKW